MRAPGGPRPAMVSRPSGATRIASKTRSCPLWPGGIPLSGGAGTDAACDAAGAAAWFAWPPAGATALSAVADGAGAPTCPASAWADGWAGAACPPAGGGLAADAPARADGAACPCVAEAGAGAAGAWADGWETAVDAAGAAAGRSACPPYSTMPRIAARRATAAPPINTSLFNAEPPHSLSGQTTQPVTDSQQTAGAAASNLAPRACPP